MAVSHGFNLTEATTSVSAPVQVSSGLQIIVGTAPVNQLANPAAAVNTPLYVSTYKEAVAAVGWSSDFAKYTLCEAISANFQVVGTAPIVVINGRSKTVGGKTGYHHQRKENPCLQVVRPVSPFASALFFARRWADHPKNQPKSYHERTAEAQSL